MIITRGYGEGARIITKGYGLSRILRVFGRAVEKIKVVLLEPKISMIPVGKPVLMATVRPLMRTPGEDPELIGGREKDLLSGRGR